MNVVVAECTTDINPADVQSAFASSNTNTEQNCSGFLLMKTSSLSDPPNRRLEHIIDLFT
jgi:hypothetical protein